MLDSCQHWQGNSSAHAAFEAMKAGKPPHCCGFSDLCYEMSVSHGSQLCTLQCAVFH